MALILVVTVLIFALMLYSDMLIYGDPVGLGRSPPFPLHSSGLGVRCRTTPAPTSFFQTHNRAGRSAPSAHRCFKQSYLPVFLRGGPPSTVGTIGYLTGHMDSHIDSAYSGVMRMAVVDTGRRRRWTREEKLRIVEESLSEGISASAVARRHGLSPSHLFAWRKELCRRADAGTDLAFAPVLVGAPAPTGQIEVVMRNGRRLVAGSDIAVHRLMEIVEALDR